MEQTQAHSDDSGGLRRTAGNPAGGSHTTRRLLYVVGALIVVVSLVVAGTLWIRSGASNAAPQGELDVIIKDGTVFDGTGSKGVLTDVGVKDGRVVYVGDLAGSEANRVVDASGLYVTPGFIDVHSHADIDAIASAKSSLTQGVTTEAIGPDGSGPYDIAAQFSELDALDKGINLAPYVGFNSVWTDIVGEADVRPTEVQFETMQSVFNQALKDGAWSVSSGLGYFPARYSKTEEVSASLGDLTRWRAMFTDHMRDETSFVVESTEENLVIGSNTGLMAEATHMKVAGPKNWGKSTEMLQMQEAARRDGRLAGGDVYPYTAASTGLSFYVPGWAQDGGTASMLDRFTDPALSVRIEQEVTDFVIDDVGEPSNILFPVLDNKTLDDLMSDYGDVTIGQAVMRTLAEHGGEIACVMQIGSEDDLIAFLKDPYVAISSDGGVTESNETHPRHYGAYPRMLGSYVREMNVLSWEEAIRKMTGLPATMLGMVDRGFLAPGMAADITIFNPERIIDRATFEDPAQFSEGVEYVFVNGDLALQDGEPTMANAGQALRRSSNMPTRPQNVAVLQRVALDSAVKGDSDQFTATVKADQQPDSSTAVGSVAVTTDDGKRFESIRLGRIQWTDGWYSLTGIGHEPGSDDEHAFVIIVDEADPLATNGETTVTVQIDGVTKARGTLLASQ